MRAFVTGANGFIGSGVSATLARAGHEVVGLVRTPEKARALAARGIEPLLGDMAEPATWRARAAACELRVHCAAEYSARHRELDRATVQELLRPSAGLVIYTSGVWIYGDTGGRTVDESAPLTPSAFLVPRLETETLVLGADSKSRRTLVIRPGCVFGGQGSLTALWFESAAKEGAVRIAGSGAQRWALVHQDDLAELYLRAAESALHGEVLNAVDHSRDSVLACAQAASRAAGTGGKSLATPLEEARALYRSIAECLFYDQQVSSEKAARLLNWRPRQRTFIEQADTLFRAWQANTPA